MNGGNRSNPIFTKGVTVFQLVTTIYQTLIFHTNASLLLDLALEEKYIIVLRYLDSVRFVRKVLHKHELC
jgi:hypothetical protein